MKSLARATTGVSLLALAALSTGGAHAQTAGPSIADSGQISEVVVTARRVSEKLQNVPLAITATTATQLQERGITDLQGLAKYTPSLSFKDFVTAFHGNPTIRGMTQINTANPVTNVGVFVDGVYLQRDYQTNQSLGDYDRIEVVKGPQSALYGANTFAGAINYVTRRPSDTYTANGTATLGNAGEERFEIGAGGPIIEGLLDARIYIGSDKYNGTIFNNAPNATGTDTHFGYHDRHAYSAGLTFTPLSNLTIDAYYSHTTKSEAIRPYYTISGKFSEDKTNCGAVSAVTGRPELFCGTFPTDPTPFRSGLGNQPPSPFSNIQPKALGQNDLLRVGVAWEISKAFSAHYTFGMTRGSASEDFNFFSNNYNPSIQPAIANNYSQQIEGGKIRYTSHEVRLNYDDGKPYKFELGYFHSDTTDAYFLGIKSIAATGAVQPPLIRYSDDPLYAPPGTIFLNNLVETFAVNAGFGRASYTFLNDRATVSAEFRYTSTSLQFNDINARTKNPALPLLNSTYNDPTPRGTIEYKVSPDNLLYASVAEGVKTGGFNGYASGTLTLLPSEQSFGEEKNLTYEVGSKNAFFDHTLIFNIDVFYIDWFDKQASVAPTNLPPNVSGALTTVANIYQTTGSARNYGVEIDGMYRPIRPLTFNYSFTAMNPTYNSGAKNTAFVGYCTVGTCPIDGSIGGNKLERQSQFSGAFAAEYRQHFKADWDYFGGADFTYQSKQYTDQENLGTIAAVALVNARIGFDNDHFKAYVWAKNLFNKLYIDNVFYVQSQQQYTASYGETRTYGITVAGKF